MINKGVIISNQNDTKEKTIVIMGVARSGTTMTAQVVHDLGVDMGNSDNNLVNERRDVFQLLENNKLAQFDKLVAEQNANYPIWGWKRPKAIEYVDLFESRIRNPHYIIPFRDYVSIAVRNNMAIDADVKENLIDTHQNRYSQVIDFVQKNKKPMLLFSYEKAVIHPRYFVSKVAEFIGVKDESRIENAVKAIDLTNNPYLNHNELEGTLDLVKNGRVHGWARKSNSKNPITLKVMVNGSFVKNIVANKPRKDLGHLGNHAFSESIKEVGLVAGQKYDIIICTQNDVPLKKCPFVYTHSGEGEV